MGGGNKLYKRRDEIRIILKHLINFATNSSVMKHQDSILYLYIFIFYNFKKLINGRSK